MQRRDADLFLLEVRADVGSGVGVDLHGDQRVESALIEYEKKLSTHEFLRWLRAFSVIMIQLLICFRRLLCFHGQMCTSMPNASAEIFAE